MTTAGLILYSPDRLAFPKHFNQGRHQSCTVMSKVRFLVSKTARLKNHSVRTILDCTSGLKSSGKGSVLYVSTCAWAIGPATIQSIAKKRRKKDPFICVG